VKFINFYKIITILDPNADVLIKNTTMEELLVWKTYRWKNVNKLCIAKVEESEESANE